MSTDIRLSLMPTPPSDRYQISDIKQKSYFRLPKSNFKPGVTLIELLLTITIASILASTAIIAYSSSQQRARDAQRKRDLDQIKKALELVKQDCRGAFYPVTPGAINPNDSAQRFTALQTSYLANTNPKYMGIVPQDPKNNLSQGFVYNYGFYSSGSNFTADVCPDTAGTRTQDGSTESILWAKLERSTDPDSATSVSKCAGKAGVTTTSGNYYVCSD